MAKKDELNFETDNSSIVICFGYVMACEDKYRKVVCTGAVVSGDAVVNGLSRILY